MAALRPVRYLEISPRQTGKTERLVQDATYQHVVNNKKIVLVGMRMSWARDLMPFVYAAGESEDEVLRQIGGRAKPEELMWYYDEFDHMRSRFSIRENGYYCTTAKYVRTFSKEHPEAILTDQLLQLVDGNGGVYATSAHNPLKRSSLAKHVRDIHPDAIKTELNGQLIAFEAS